MATQATPRPKGHLNPRTGALAGLAIAAVIALMFFPWKSVGSSDSSPQTPVCGTVSLSTSSVTCHLARKGVGRFGSSESTKQTGLLPCFNPGLDSGTYTTVQFYDTAGRLHDRNEGNATMPASGFVLTGPDSDDGLDITFFYGTAKGTGSSCTPMKSQ